MLSVKKQAILWGLVVVAPLVAQAASQPRPVTLPVGVVACNSYKNAKDYSAYAKDAPHFAEAMLARADCFVPKEAMEAVTVTQANDYTSLKLLSGHRVWVPSHTILSISR
jgi:hypothetical protein